MQSIPLLSVHGVSVNEETVNEQIQDFYLNGRKNQAFILKRLILETDCNFPISFILVKENSLLFDLFLLYFAVETNSTLNNPTNRNS